MDNEALKVKIIKSTFKEDSLDIAIGQTDSTPYLVYCGLGVRTSSGVGGLGEKAGSGVLGPRLGGSTPTAAGSFGASDEVGIDSGRVGTGLGSVGTGSGRVGTG